MKATLFFSCVWLGIEKKVHMGNGGSEKQPKVSVGAISGGYTWKGSSWKGSTASSGGRPLGTFVVVVQINMATIGCH